ncbi:MAG TPA: CAP domain-containing protein, partial [Roseiflexaceae bacterium]|nr:CAP domain-containing protein [Roseiflexaceae bacterium]
MIRHLVTRIPLLLIVASLVALAPGRGVSAQTSERCFTETGFCMSGRIREFWEQNGGLPVFGYPIGPQQQAMVEGRALQVQLFERNRLELHPENARPYDVLLGRLGADRLTQLGKDWQTYPKSSQQAGCRYFEQTGQNVCGEILAAWRANGLEIDGKRGKTEAESLALFGLPLSPVVTERQSDGVERQVQWFERARFELHPENARPYDVLLGR